MWVAYKPVDVEIEDNGTRICIQFETNMMIIQGLITFMHSTPLFKHKSLLSSSMRIVFLRWVQTPRKDEGCPLHPN